MGRLQTLKWDDFSGGEFGDTPRHKAARNQFTGLNVLVYKNGEIGPRPGISTLDNSPTWDGDDVYGAGFVGQPANAHWVASMDSTPDLIIKVRNLNSNTWDASRQPTVVLGTNAAKQTVAVEAGPDEIFFLVPGETFIHYEGNLGGIPSTTEITDITGTLTPGRALAIYRERLFTSVGNTVYYSDNSDFTSFTIATDFFQVGPGPEIRWMGWQNDELLIITQDSSIYSYRGVPGRDSLRRVYDGRRHPWNFYHGRAFVTPSGDFIFVPVDRDYPAYYSGGRIVELKHLKALEGAISNAVDDVHVDGMIQDDEVFIWFSGGHPDDASTARRALMNLNGVWTQHKFTPLISGVPTTPYNYISSDRQRIIYIHSVNTANGGSGGVDRNQGNTFDMFLDRPGFTSDTYANVGDNSTTPLDAWFELPDFWLEDGSMLRVKEVKIDFTKYRTGQSQTTHIGVEVDVLAHGTESGETTQTYTSFDEANTSASTSGTRDRHIARGVSGGPKRGSGFRLRLSDLRAVTIRSISVVLELDDGSIQVQP